MSKYPKSTALTGILAISLLASSAWSQDRQMKDGDLKDLGKKLAEFIEAKASNKDVWEAETEVKDAIDKVTKKLKGRDALSSPADLGYALWLAKDYAKARVTKGKVTTIEHEVFGKEDAFEYALWAPSKYSARDQAYPLMICIPEAGMDPKTYLTEHLLDQDIRAGAILVAVPMPEDPALWTESGAPGNPGGLGYVLTTLRHVSDSYAIDFDRVYLCGRGDGVAIATKIAGRFPDRFAGVIGRAGDVGEGSPANFRNLPTYFAGAGAQASAFEAKVKELGFDNCTIDPDGKEEDVWVWIQDHARIANPVEVTLVPGDPFPTRAYWLQVPQAEYGGSASVDAKADRETNTIVIEANGIADVAVYFNDAIVDLDKPVTVICNGAEHVDEIPRSLKVTLDLIFQARSDPGKLYVATKSYHLPAREGE